MTWADINSGDSIEGKGKTAWWVTAIRNKDAGKTRIVTIERGDKVWTIEKGSGEEVVRLSEGAEKIKGVGEHDLAIATVEAHTAPGTEIIASVGDDQRGIWTCPVNYRNPGTYLAHLARFHGIKDPKLGDPRHVHEGGPGYVDHTHEQ